MVEICGILEKPVSKLMPMKVISGDTGFADIVKLLRR